MTSHKIDPNFSLANKVAMITGGAAGIGRAIADLFAEKGAKLVLVDKSDSVRDVAAEFSAKGIESFGLAADITIRANIEQFVEEASSRFGSIDILVNNAGVVLLAPAEELTDQAWDVTMAVNLKAPYMISQIVGRKMIAQRSGKIINLASQAGLVALDQHLAYCASKAAIDVYMEGLRIALRRRGVAIAPVRPGFVDTAIEPMDAAATPFLISAETAARKIARVIDARKSGVVSVPLRMAALTAVIARLPDFLGARLIGEGR